VLSRILLASRTLLCSLAVALQAQPAIDVLLSQYDLDRTGANLQERILRPANVNSRHFGRIFTRDVDSSIYALPLIASNVTLPNGQRRNLLIVATMRNTLYAFDADDPAPSAAQQPLWTRNLGPAPELRDNWIGPTHWGILSTPFIDRSTNTIYAVTKVQPAAPNTAPVQQVNAVDLITGALKFNSPQNVSFPFSGAGGQVINGQAGQIQRAGLLVHAGVLYVAYANVLPDPSNRESQEGFLQSYNATDLRQRYASFQSTPTGLKGGIWQGGRGLTVDPQGFIYAVTAGGEYNGTDNFGTSVLKFEPRTLRVVDWFTPANWDLLYHGNLDISANGVTLIPGSGLAFAGGKEGVIYLLDRTAGMGRLEGAAAGASSPTGPLQRFRATQGCFQTDCTQSLGTAFWSRPDQPSSLLYVWDRRDALRMYPFDHQTQRFVTSAPQTAAGTVRPEQNGGPAVSALGGDPDSGIVWALTVNADANFTLREATLRAFRATNIAEELYHSDENRNRDAVGFFTKFAPPVIANGKVYAVTHSNRVSVYGLLNPKTLRIQVNGGGVVRGTPGGIQCSSSGGADCTAVAAGAADSFIELTASPGPANLFAGWSGACSGASLTCRVAMPADQTVTASFTAAARLTVAKGGTGTGRVRAIAGSDLDCGPVCEAGFAPGSAVTLQTSAAPGSVFAGWAGADCGSEPECTVTLRESLTITATFNRIAIFSGESGQGLRFVPLDTPSIGEECAQVNVDLRAGVLERLALPDSGCGGLKPATLIHIAPAATTDVELAVEPTAAPPVTIAAPGSTLVVTGGIVALRAAEAASVRVRILGHFVDASSTQASSLGFQPWTPCRLFEIRIPENPQPTGRQCPAPEANTSAYAVQLLATPAATGTPLERFEIQPGFVLSSPSGTPVSGFAILPPSGWEAAASAPVHVSADALGTWSPDSSSSFAGLHLFAAPCVLEVDAGAPAIALDACTAAGSASPLPDHAIALLVHMLARPEGPLERLTLWSDGVDEPASLTHLTSVSGAAVSGLTALHRPSAATFLRIASSAPAKLRLSVLGYFAAAPPAQ